MTQASRRHFGKHLVQFLLVALVLYLIAFTYLRSVAGESNPGLTASKILALGFLFLASNAAQILIVLRSANTSLLSVFWTNLGIWLVFFVLLLIDALTLHPGLAKDAASGFPDAARFFLLQFAVLGLPFVLLNTLVGITAVRLLKGSRWTASRRRRGNTK